MKKMLVSLVVAGSLVVGGVLGLTSYEAIETNTISVNDIINKDLSSATLTINGENVTVKDSSHSKLFLYKEQGIENVVVATTKNVFGQKKYKIERTY